MTSISDWLDKQAQSPQSDLSELRYLVCHLLGKSSAWLFANSDASLDSNHVNQLDAWVDQLQRGKPLAYITGEKAFWNLNLKVNEHTLIPRPETEVLIETIKQLELNPQTILDLGTGSGAIALSLATEFPEAEIVASDLSPEALEVARENGQNNQISNVEFVLSDWFLSISNKLFDLIVSNPPYIDANDEHLSQLTFEPLSALVADNQGLAAYQQICAQAKNHLTVNGVLMFEHGWQQHQAVASIMKEAGFSHIQHQKDLLGHQRITWGIFKT